MSLLINKCDRIDISTIHLATIGKLTALNKVSIDEQSALEDNNEDRKIRPINGGSMLLKQPFKALLKTDPVLRAKESLAPFQLGLDSPGGPEKVAHTFFAASQAGQPILKTDCFAAFQHLTRQTQLDSIDNACPEATNIFNTYYGRVEPVGLYFHYDDNDEMTVACHLSSEGPRQGCTLGSFSFDLGFDTIIKPLADKYPSYIIKLLTDDSPATMPTPQNEEEWHNLYQMVSDFLKDFEILGRPKGVILNMDKCEFLIPTSSPQPKSGVLPEGLIKRDGLIIAGVPCGSNQFINEFLEDKTLQIAKKIKCILTAAKQEPQGVTRLLKHISQSWTYISRIIPPDFMKEYYERFDTLIFYGLCQSITSPGEEDITGICSRERLERAKLKSQLRISDNGFGFTSLSTISPIAYLSGVICASKDADFTSLKPHISKFIRNAHTLVIDLFAGYDKIPSLIKSCIPPDPASIIQGNFITDLFEQLGNKKLQKRILEAAQTAKRLHFRDKTHPSRAQDPGPNCSLTKSDAIHLHLCTSKSQGHRILTAPLSKHINRIPPSQFISWARFYLNLPPPPRLGNSRKDPLSDCSLDFCQDPKCGGSHSLDPCGNHASSNCSSIKTARYRLHNSIVRVVHAFGQRAGLESSGPEPRTDQLLLHQYTPSQCRALFPKNPNKEDQRRSELISSLLSKASNQEGADKAQTLREAKDITEEIRADKQGLRIDLALTNPNT